MIEDSIISKEERELYEGVLDEQEQTWVQQFCENEVMREAVKKVLLVPIFTQGVLKKGKKARVGVNWAFAGLNAGNENYGATQRAKAAGIDFVEKGFEMLEKIFKKEKVEEGRDKRNPAT